MTTNDETLKVWTTAAATAIAAGAPITVITAWLDGGLTPEPQLFKTAAHAHRVDVLIALFDAAKARGQHVVEAGAMAALAAPAASDASVLDNAACTVVVTRHTTPAMLNRSVSTVHGAGSVPFWWHAFRNADETGNLRGLLALLEGLGADLAATPFNDDGGRRHGEALRAFLLAQRIEQERVALREAVAEATEQPTTTAARGRRRL
ncbi:hypothetical protein [Paraburkholderia dilworthii]|uniref:Uncharacterized protein n=1 Tax=Paraburkholderia dilworthii TaxID=948106 RepID=A0ABW9D749_9BURK